MNGQFEGEVQDLTVHAGEEIREQSLEVDAEPQEEPSLYPDGSRIARFLRGMLLD